MCQGHADASRERRSRFKCQTVGDARPAVNADASPADFPRPNDLQRA
jgi:hypothetical protein